MGDQPRDGGLFARLLRLFGGADDESQATQPAGTMFTAHSLSGTVGPSAQRDEPETLFDEAPSSRGREPDLWDHEPLVGPTQRPPMPPPAPPPPPDERAAEEPAAEEPAEERLFDRAPGPPPPPPDEPEPTVSELTDELERLAADDESPAEADLTADDGGVELPEPQEPQRPTPPADQPGRPNESRFAPTTGSASEQPDELAPRPRQEIAVQPALTTESTPPAVDDLQRDVSVHDDRIDRRPGPIRMTPSEALALAKNGPAALKRRRPDG